MPTTWRCGIGSSAARATARAPRARRARLRGHGDRRRRCARGAPRPTDGRCRRALARALRLAVLPPHRPRRPRRARAPRAALRRAFAESEDYDLWTRLLERRRRRQPARAPGALRVHAGQASKRRSELQRSFQRGLRCARSPRSRPSSERPRPSWRGARGARHGRVGHRRAFASRRFSSSWRRSRQRYPAGRRVVARAAARRLAAVARHEPAVWRHALRLDPAPSCGRAPGATRPAPGRRGRRDRGASLADRARRGRRKRPGPRRRGLARADAVSHRHCSTASPSDPSSTSPSSTRRAPCSDATWEIEPRHRAVFLRGTAGSGRAAGPAPRLPGHPGVVRRAARARPEVVVVSGWSTFASQAAVAWCRRHGVPYVLLVASNDDEPAPGWRRAARRVVGTDRRRRLRGARRRHALASRLEVRGLDPARISLFANTIDVAAWTARERTPRRRGATRSGPSSTSHRTTWSCSRSRGSRPRRASTRSCAPSQERATDGSCSSSQAGPEREPRSSTSRASSASGFSSRRRPWERIVERYVVADIFAFLSRHEPWGVVVNEAAACGLPLVLSDRVGAALDLLEDGENGELVPVDDVAAAASRAARLAADPQAGTCRRGLARSSWPTGATSPSIENLIRSSALARSPGSSASA